MLKHTFTVSFISLVIGCGAPAGNNPGGVSQQSGAVACDTDSECPSDHTCVVGAGKPGGKADAPWDEDGDEDGSWADGDDWPSDDTWPADDDGATDQATPDAENNPDEEPAGDGAAAQPDAGDAAAAPTQKKAGMCQPKAKPAGTTGGDTTGGGTTGGGTTGGGTTGEVETPPATGPTCDGAWSLGETFVKGNTHIGECNQSTPTNCADGVWISFDDGQCMCIVRCSSLQSNPGIGDACSGDGAATCQRILADKGNKITACVPKAWNLCTEDPSAAVEPPKEDPAPSCKGDGASCSEDDECCGGTCWSHGCG